MLADNLPTISKRVRPGDEEILAEGFGLTVAEAMWKGRAVVAFGIAESLLDCLRLIRCVFERRGVRAAT